jgi:hypothetical protein
VQGDHLSLAEGATPERSGDSRHPACLGCELDREPINSTEVAIQTFDWPEAPLALAIGFE